MRLNLLFLYVHVTRPYQCMQYRSTGTWLVWIISVMINPLITPTWYWGLVGPGRSNTTTFGQSGCDNFIFNSVPFLSKHQLWSQGIVIRTISFASSFRCFPLPTFRDHVTKPICVSAIWVKAKYNLCNTITVHRRVCLCTGIKEQPMKKSWIFFARSIVGYWSMLKFSFS